MKKLRWHFNTDSITTVFASDLIRVLSEMFRGANDCRFIIFIPNTGLETYRSRGMEAINLG